MVSQPWRAEREVVREPSTPRRGSQRAAALFASSEQAVSELLAAFELLTHRGSGVSPWAAPFLEHPVAFLLDTMTDAMNVWGSEGELLYQNRAAAALGLGRREAAALEVFTSRGRRFERRCLSCRLQGAEYVLEIIHEL
jgi:hypothetical protein